MAACDSVTTAHRCLQKVPQRNPDACSLGHYLALQACPASHCLFLAPQSVQVVWWGVCSVLALRLALVVSCHPHHPQLLGHNSCDIVLPQPACSANAATEVICTTPDGRTAAQIAACPDQALLVVHPLLRLFSCLPRCSQNQCLMSTKDMNFPLMNCTYGREVQLGAKLPTSRGTVAIVPDQAAMQDSCPIEALSTRRRRRSARKTFRKSTRLHTELHGGTWRHMCLKDHQ